jgi:hypothetical protein
MIKTNMYASGDYGVFEITHKIVDKEGLRGLLRGWSAAYVRLGKLEKDKNSNYKTKNRIDCLDLIIHSQ